YLGCVFFFQAEDGIRGRNVTGVQTCALPIFVGESGSGKSTLLSAISGRLMPDSGVVNYISESGESQDLYRQSEADRRKVLRTERSEERRVGKEGNSRAWQVWRQTREQDRDTG